ncbi:conjugal transfer protein [Streptomyces sp. NPDC021100]|uniref:conjugal transfer protein n=1 Tax=Streptomyces sp. NPDC021100 TaxID=3365114 RepID=UPI0037AAEEC1
MKGLIKRRTAAKTPGTEHAVEEWAVDSAANEDVGIGGWSTGARANTTVLMRWTAWGLLIAGPLLGLAAYVSVPSTAGSVRPQTAPAAPATTGSQGAAGFATLFVAAFVEAGEGDQDKLAAYYPAATDVRLEGEPGRQKAAQLTVVRLRQTEADVWSVTVAARLTPNGPAPTPTSTARPANGQQAKKESVRYFQVPVAAAAQTGGATGYVALALPAEVAPVDRIQAPKLVYGPMRPALPADPRTKAVAEFLNAYLTGSGELDRYLAPGTRLSPVMPAPYSAITVDQLAVEGEMSVSAEQATTVPEDGTRLRLLATVRAAGADGVRTPLTYALTLSARAGRWEIASLDGAPTPAAASPSPVSTH